MAVHKWRTVDTTSRNGVNFFVYECKRCSVKTLNGMPLDKPYDKECSRENVRVCHGFGKSKRVFKENLTGFL